jgi:beta-lactamase regulating signal transducer with metallopeptidase domain
MGTSISTVMSSAIPTLVDVALKGAVLLALAGLATAALWRASAAMRHLVWSLTMAGLLALPVLSALLPQWRVLPQWSALSKVEGRAPAPTAARAPAPVTPTATPTPQIAPPAAPEPAFMPTSAQSPATRANDLPSAGKPSRPWSDWLLPFWILGAALALLPVVVGRLALRRLSRAARPIGSGSWTALLQTLAQEMRLRRSIILLETDRPVMPMAWGIRRARVLVPAESEKWTSERRRAVLLHEIAHVRRRDCLTQFLTNLACAMHWFNPLAWIARRRMVAERERACYDLVLSAGFEPSDYAQHLLQIASTLRGGLLTSGAAIAMARPSKLEGRLLAVLDGKRSRRGLTRSLVLAGLVLTLGIAVPLATLHAQGPDAKSPEGGKEAKTAASEFVAALPSGGTVELLGVSYNPSKGKPWWKPDGTALSPGFVTSGSSVFPRPECQAREFVVRVEGLPQGSYALKWKLEPPGSSAGGQGGVMRDDGKSAADLNMIAAETPLSAKSVTVKIGVATGAWQDAEQSPPGESQVTSGQEFSASFGKGYELRGKATVMTVSHNIKDQDVRLVAVDLQDKEHVCNGMESGSLDAFSQVTATFDLPLDQVKIFRLQKRPYNWIEFHDVALEPFAESAKGGAPAPVGNPHDYLAAGVGVGRGAPAPVGNPKEDSRAPDPLRVREMIAVLKVSWANVAELLRKGDAKGATIALEDADVLPLMDQLHAELHGTAADEPVGQAVGQVREALAALKAGDVERAKALIMKFDTTGPMLEETITQATDQGHVAGQSPAEMIDATVYVESAGRDTALDLDTGKFIVPPADISFIPDTSQFLNWCRKSGADVVCIPKPSSPDLFGLLMVDAAVIETSDGQAIDRAAAAARQKLQGRPLLVDNPLRPMGNFPFTCLFKTREGGIGILQILGVTDNPKGVKIRYKMVQQTLTEPAQPGSQVSVEKAVSDPQFAFAAVCEAVEAPTSVIGEPIGVLNENQSFKLIQLLSGQTPPADEFKVRYRWTCNPVPLERPIRKGERVIWLLARLEGTRVAGQLPFRGIKALSDTPENRKAVVAAATLHEEPSWGEAVNGLQCGIGSAFVSDSSATLSVFLRNVGDKDESVIQVGSLFELECDGARYAHQGWNELGAKSTHMPPGRKVGPIFLNLAEYIPFDERTKGRDAPHPLAYMAPGEHRVRAIYVGSDGKLNIRSGEIPFALPAPAEKPKPSTRVNSDDKNISVSSSDKLSLTVEVAKWSSDFEKLAHDGHRIGPPIPQRREAELETPSPAKGLLFFLIPAGQKVEAQILSRSTVTCSVGEKAQVRIGKSLLLKLDSGPQQYFDGLEVAVEPLSIKEEGQLRYAVLRVTIQDNRLESGTKAESSTIRLPEGAGGGFPDIVRIGADRYVVIVRVQPTGSAPAPAEKPKENITELPNGAQVQLIGIAQYPRGESACWTADGTVIENPPPGEFQPPLMPTVPKEMQGRVLEMLKRQPNLRQFAVRVENLSGNDATVQLRAFPWGECHAVGMSMQSPQPPERAASEPGLWGLLAAFPDDPPATGIRVGVSAGEWDITGRGLSNMPTSFMNQEGQGSFHDMSEAQGNARLTTTDTFVSRDMRLVAIDEKGTPHVGRILNSRTVEKSRTATAVFEGLSLAQVKEFQLHTRPFQWAEFTNVSLRSGKKTDVQVTVKAGFPLSRE